MNAFTQVSSLLQFNTKESPIILYMDMSSDGSGSGSIFTLFTPLQVFNGSRLIAIVGVDILLKKVVKHTEISKDRAVAKFRAYNGDTQESDKDELLNPCGAKALPFNEKNSKVIVALPTPHIWTRARTSTRADNCAGNNHTNDYYQYT